MASIPSALLGVASRLGRVGRVAGLVLLLLSALIISAAVHLNHPAVRHVVVEFSNATLRRTLMGEVHVRNLEHLSLTAVRVDELTVLDPMGNEVLLLRGVSADLPGWAPLLRALLSERGRSLRINHLRANQAHVRVLLDSGSGEVTLAQAFTSRLPAETSTEQRAVRQSQLWLPHVEVGELTGRVELPGFDGYRPRFAGVRGSVHIANSGISLNVERFGTTISGFPRADVQGTGTFSLRPGQQLAGTFAGFVGDVEAQLSVQYDPTQMHAVVSVPHVTPTAARALWPDWPLRDPSELRVSLDGEFPRLAVSLSAAVDQTAIEAQGTWLTTPPQALNLDVDVVDLNLQNLVAGTARTNFDVQAELQLKQTPRGLSAAVRGSTAPGAIEGVAIPGANFSLATDGTSTSYSLEVREPGAHISAQGTLSPVDNRADCSLQIASIDLSQQRRIPDGLSGTASLSADIHYRDGNLGLRALANARQLRAGDLYVRQGNVIVSTQFPLQLFAEARVKASLSAEDAKYGAVQFSRANLRLDGTRHGADVQAALSDPDGRAIEFKGKVLPDLTLQHVDATASRGALRAAAHIDTLDLQEPAITVSALQLDGPDLHLEGGGRYRPGLVEGNLHGTGISLAKLSHLLGIASLPIAGTAELDVEVAIGPDLQRAHARASIRDASILHVGRTSGEVDVQLRGDELTGSLSLNDETFGEVDSQVELTLAGFPLLFESYAQATGTASIELRDFELEKLNLLDPSSKALNMDGRVDVRAQLARSDANAPPDVRLQLGVSRLKIAAPEVTTGALPINSLSASAEYSAARGSIDVLARADDASGVLFNWRSTLLLDAWALLRTPERALSLLRHAPFRAAVEIPRRQLQTLGLDSLAGLDGAVEGHLDLQGIAEAPQAHIQLNLDELAAIGFARGTLLSLNLEGDYATLSGNTALRLRGTSQGRRVLSGQLQAIVPWTSLQYGGPFEAQATLDLHQVPLQALSALSAMDISGTTSGQVRWQTADAQPLHATLQLSDVFTGRTPLGQGELRVHSTASNVGASFRMAHEKAALAIDATAVGTPGRFGVPAVLESVDGTLHATSLNAAVLNTVLSSVVARLDGKLDANVRFGFDQVRAQPGAALTWKSDIQGNAILRDGSGYVEGLGLELQDVSLSADARSVGFATQVTLRDIAAKARSDVANLQGRANLTFDGQGLLVADAQALLRSVPLTLQGQNLGLASGQLKANFERESGFDGAAPFTGVDYLRGQIQIDNWRLNMAPSASRSLVSLNPNQDIVVKQHQLRKRVTDELFAYRIGFVLGNDVHVALAEQELTLAGRVNLDYTDVAQFSGLVTLEPGGRIVILGHTFDVASGTVRFNPRDAANPDIRLALNGRSADGSAITVSVAGTWREPITDPPLSELQQLLGGGTASALSGGMQALGLGSLFGSTFQLSLSSTDAEESVPSPTASFQIDDNLWFEANYQREKEDGLTQQNSAVVSGTLDYRFQNNWSLRTKVGNASGSLDLSWQYRY